MMFLTEFGHHIRFNDFESMDSMFPAEPFYDSIKSFVIKWFDPELSEIEILTSGSTGTPKMIRLRKNEMIKSAIKTQNYFNYKSGSTAVLCLPPDYIAGMMMLVRAFISNLKLILITPCQDPFSVNISNSKIDFIPMTPMQLESSLMNSSINASDVQTILLGGAPISKPLLKRIQSLDVAVYIGYGMTETITHVAMKKLNSYDQSNSYTALPGVTFKTDDENCLSIKADHLSAEIQINDVVELIDERRFNWIGRRDLIINSGGIKINPVELEVYIHEIISNNCFFTSVDDEKLGRKLVLIIEKNDANEDIDFDSIWNQIIKRFDKYHIPKIVYSIDSIKYTESKKINRIDSTTHAQFQNQILHIHE